MSDKLNTLFHKLINDKEHDLLFNHYAIQKVIREMERLKTEEERLRQERRDLEKEIDYLREIKEEL